MKPDKVVGKLNSGNFDQKFLCSPIWDPSSVVVIEDKGGNIYEILDEKIFSTFSCLPMYHNIV